MALKISVRGLLALNPAEKAQYQEWVCRKYKQFRGFGQLAALYVSLDVSPIRTGKHFGANDILK